MDVFKGDDIPPESVDKSFYRIQRHAMSCILRFEVKGLAYDLFALERNDTTVMTHLSGNHPETSAVLDDAADGGYGRQGQIVQGTKRGKHDVNLVFPDIGMRLALPSDLSYETRIPDAFSSSPGSPFLLIERLGFLATLIELLLPKKQGGSLDWERVQSRTQAVFLPKDQDAGFLKGFGCNHIRRA